MRPTIAASVRALVMLGAGFSSSFGTSFSAGDAVFTGAINDVEIGSHGIGVAAERLASVPAARDALPVSP